MRVRPFTLLWVLLAWMLLVGAGCGLIFLEYSDRWDDRPRRTRPAIPLD